MEAVPFELIRWLEGSENEISAVCWGNSAKFLHTRTGGPAVLVTSDWHLGYVKDKNPAIRFHERADWMRQASAA